MGHAWAGRELRGCRRQWEGRERVDTTHFLSLSAWGLEECLNLKKWEAFIQCRLPRAHGWPRAAETWRGPASSSVQKDEAPYSIIIPLE